MYEMEIRGGGIRKSRVRRGRSLAVLDARDTSSVVRERDKAFLLLAGSGWLHVIGSVEAQGGSNYQSNSIETSVVMIQILLPSKLPQPCSHRLPTTHSNQDSSPRLASRLVRLMM